MTASEWDNLVAWFKRSRLRSIALIVAWIFLVAGIIAFVGNAMITGDADSYSCNGKPATEMEYDANVYDCDRQFRGGKAEWDFGLLVPFIGVAAGIFLVPLLNTGVIGGRGAIRRWNESDNRRLRRENADHRDRLRAAEAVSNQAEREAARLQRELDSLISPGP